jgi:hypothetical protein
MRRTLFLVLFLTALLGISGVWAATINVPGDYTTIQAAINGATAGDIIQIAAGTYSEALLVNKSLKLMGPNSEISAVTGTRVSEARLTQKIDISATTNVEISGVEMYEVNPGSSWTFYIQGNSDGFTFRNNRFINNVSTVIKSGLTSVTANLIVTGNLVSGVTGTGQSGLSFGGVSGISIISNNKLENITYSGILLENSSVVVSGNSISNTTQQGIQLGPNCANVTVSGNTITNTNTLLTSDKGGIRLYASSFTGPVTISGNIISGSYNGIAIRDGSGTLTQQQQSWIQIRNNDLSGNANYGVYMPATSSGYDLDARENWWGDPAGPTSPGAKYGVGVTDHVLYDPWWADLAMTDLESNSYMAGESYSFTVSAPNSLDGAQAKIWGFYTNTSNAWVNATYGTGTFTNGLATVNYIVPADFKSNMYWEVLAYQTADSQTRSILWNTVGPWDQFDTYMLDGQTLNIDTYRFDDFTYAIDSASFAMVGAGGAIPTVVDYSTVEVLSPWSGDIADYDNSLYNNDTLYRKIGFYPTYAANLGYTVEVVASNPGSPAFQQIRITKPSIGYDITLFGYHCATTSDPTGWMWWTTFPKVPVSEMTMSYNPGTGICSGTFTTPLSYGVQYFIQPYAEINIPATDLVYSYEPGSMDMLLNGVTLGPVHNVTRDLYYSTIQAAIDAASSGDVIQVAPGTYNEAVVINKGITLEATGTSAETIINCPAGSLTSGVKILGTDLGTVTLDGFTVQGWTENGIVQGMGSGLGTTVHILNNIVVSNGTYMRNGIQVSGNGSTVIGNTVYGATLTEDWAGSAILVVNADDVLIQDNYVTGGDIGIGLLCYTASLSPMTGIVIDGNTVEENNYGIDLQGNYWSQPWSQYSISCSITGNDLINNLSCGISAEWTQLGIFDVSDNTFTGHPVNVANWSETTLEMTGYLDPENTYDAAYLVNQVIYGNAAALYVDVPDEVIPNNYAQTYSVVATAIENLRGFTVQVKLPKADFETAPSAFTIGTSFSSYPLGAQFYATDVSDATYWIYDVTGAYLGGYAGITGTDVVLFTFSATSSADPYSNVVVPGCYIELDYDSVVLKDDQNPYNEIPCAGTENGWVLIDSADPAVAIDNIVTYPDGMTLPVDGSGVVLPLLDLTYTDDWDLFSAMYLIQDAALAAPDDPADFSLTVGTVNGTLTDIDDWQLPAGALPDGTYTLYLLVTDEVGYFYILPWTFTIDTEAPTALAWTLCHTTPNANVSVDLAWTYDTHNAPAYINIWALDYSMITSITTNEYPEYDPTDLIVAGTIVNDIGPYTSGPSTLGWVKAARIPLATALTLDTSVWASMVRGYYYFTIYGEAANGQMSEAPADPFYRESISYWPGDVSAIDGTVVSSDIALLTANWGLTPGNPIVDVGPSTDYARRSRPMPDNLINIEDLMMFAMNYDNTDYEYYPRIFPDAEPITIAMNAHSVADVLTLTLELGGNTGFVKGLDIPIAYGSGLQLVSVESGEAWPEGSLLLNTDHERVITVSGATLGADPIVEGNGIIAILTFAITGNDASFELQHMTARTWDNHEVEIVNNPGSYTDNDDLINVVPDENYLGSVFPNPFNPSTTIQYGLKDAGNVRLSVFNSRGQLLRTLVNESKSAGTYQIGWNGRDNNGRQVSSGVYFFRMETREGVKTTKGLMIK